MRAQRVVHTEHLERLLNAAANAHNLTFSYDAPTSRELRIALEPFGRAACAACSQIRPSNQLVRASITAEYTGRTYPGEVCEPCVAMGTVGEADPLRIDVGGNPRKAYR